MNHRFSNHGGIQNSETQPPETVKRCVTCQKNNDVPAATTHQQHIPQLHQGHFVTCKLITYRCPLVKENWRFGSNRQFSRLVEAYPTGRATATHTAKCLVTDFIPRWGLPDCIDSDQGTHFTGQVVRKCLECWRLSGTFTVPIGTSIRTGGTIKQNNQNQAKQNASGRSTMGGSTARSTV